MKTTTIVLSPLRPLELLTGDNLGIVRQRLGRIHCMTEIRSQLRHARPVNFRRQTADNIGLRRGWALAVLSTVAEYRRTFVYVMNGSAR